MIATAKHTAISPAPGSPAMAGNKIAMAHRLHLTDGRVLEGDLHRAPNSRLADHLAALKGFVSVTNAACERSGAIFPYLVVNVQHILFIEEIADAAPQLEPGNRLSATTRFE